MKEKDREKMFRWKDVFNIPNVLCYIRILMIPIIVMLYFQATTTADYLICGLLIALSGLTDLLDGYIARKYDMVTEIGKTLDPVADKLTQFAILFCLIYRYDAMVIVVGIFVIKELFMAINGAVLLRRGKKLDGALWFGKLSTAGFYGISLILIAFPGIPLGVVHLLLFFVSSLLILSLVCYIPVFIRMYRDSYHEAVKGKTE